MWCSKMNLYVSCFLTLFAIHFVAADDQLRQYETIYIEDLCYDSSPGVLNVGSSTRNSSGILKTTRNGKFFQNQNCTILIQPPLGYGITLSVEHIDFRPYYSPDCENYVQISDYNGKVQLCGYSDDRTEFQSYYSDGKALELNFVTGNKTSNAFQSDVTFVVTAYVKLPYSCGIWMFQCRNDRCIWDGLTCDGHNNCGDGSDEYQRGGANCGKMPTLIVVFCVVGSLLGAVIVSIIVCVCVNRQRRSRRDRRENPPLLQATPHFNTASPNFNTVSPNFNTVSPNFNTVSPNFNTVSPRNNIQEVSDPQPSSSVSPPRYQDMPPAYKP